MISDVVHVVNFYVVFSPNTNTSIPIPIPFNNFTTNNLPMSSHSIKCGKIRLIIVIFAQKWNLKKGILGHFCTLVLVLVLKGKRVNTNSNTWELRSFNINTNSQPSAARCLPQKERGGVPPMHWWSLNPKGSRKPFGWPPGRFAPKVTQDKSQI